MIGKIRRSIWEEIRPDLIKLDCAPLKLFAIPKLHIPYQPYSWIIYNVIMALWFNFWFIFALFYWGSKPWYPRGTDSRAKYWMYGSNWSYVVASLYFIPRVPTILIYHWKTGFKVTSSNHQELDPHEEPIQKKHKKTTKPDNLKLPWYVKIMWFLQIHVYAAQVITSITRWAQDTGEPDQFAVNPIDIQHHALGIFLLTVDFLLLASPYRLQHVFWSSIIPTIYILFTVIYYFAGGTNPHHINKEINGDTYIYLGKLDWGQVPITSVVMSVLGIFVGFPLVYFMYYLLQKLRDTCIEWYYFKKQTGH